MVMVRKRFAQSGPLQQDAVSGEAVRQDATSPGRVWRARGTVTQAASSGGAVLMGDLTSFPCDLLAGLMYEVDCIAPVKNTSTTTSDAVELKVEASSDEGQNWTTLISSGTLAEVEPDAEVTRRAYGDIRLGSAINRLRVVAVGATGSVVYGGGTVLRVEEHGAEP